MINRTGLKVGPKKILLRAMLFLRYGFLKTLPKYRLGGWGKMSMEVSQIIFLFLN